MKKTRKVSFWKNNDYMIKLVWNICPGRVIIDFLLAILSYATWIFYSIIFIKYIMHAIETEKRFRSIVLFIVISAVVTGVIQLLEAWYQYEYRLKTDTALYEKMGCMLFQKASRVELACYEDTEFYNRYTLAMKESDVRIASVLKTTAGIVSGIIASVGVLWNMFLIDRYVILFVAAPLIGNFVFGKLLNQQRYQRSQECVPHQRKMDYVNRTIYLADYAKEIRMSNVFSILKKYYEEGFTGILKVLQKYQKKMVSLGIWQNIFTFLIIFQGVMFYSIYRTMVTKSITLSSFVVLSSAMVSASWILIRLSGNILEAYQNSLYVENLKQFLEYEPLLSEEQEGNVPSNAWDCLEFKNVSFTYRGKDAAALKESSLTIKKGEKIAIVGHNGAGKTTWIKLLLRLYDVSGGEILLGGQNIRGYGVKAYRALFGTAFQEYQVFSMTIAENVLMRKPQHEDDYRKAAHALKRSGVYEKVMSLPKGMDTILTKEFAEDGAVLSGGEMQKIAVSRVFAGKYEIAIFDEPSSALDPVAEYQLYKSIMEECREKTVIFISHRLSAAALADTVYLFSDGEIPESGSHEELMAKNGLYADMFRKQAESYQADSMGGQA